ncbi:transcription repressor OFP7-like [Forsythia ovata]|uniref:Transcription repressor n=1 Tax=Forsythia ovata TaxID=205694 RepID=A0ABD1NX27_9LAMI
MAKQPKIRLSLLSFQLCRPTKSSLLPKVPLPAATYKFSSAFNSRSFDISYPNFPSPPPSTPNHSLNKCNMNSKITSLGSGSCSMQCKDETASPVYYKMKKVDKPNAKMHNYTVSRVEREGKKDKITTKKLKASVSTSISSANSDKTKSILSSSPKSDLPNDLDYPLKTKREGPLNENKKMKQKVIKSQRFNHCTSNNEKDGNRTVPESESRVKKSVYMVDGKVKESFVVEKRSADPYEDFKKSMLEMILEKQMFDANELDQLVLCFLSLNSRQYHAVILKAFVEIWEELFSGSTN